jgi:hypothetical protein
MKHHRLNPLYEKLVASQPNLSYTSNLAPDPMALGHRGDLRQRGAMALNISPRRWQGKRFSQSTVWENPNPN